MHELTKTERQDKLISLAAAASRVNDGARIALGGFGLYNRPMAFVRELIRQERKRLTLVATTSGQDAELLIGAGCIDRLETSYIGLEKWGLARRARAAIESGAIDMADYGEVMSFDRFRITEDGWTFLPVDYLGGNSLLDFHPDFVEFDCPITGRKLHAVPPADPEIAIIHVPAADRFGNAMLPATRLMPQGLDAVLSRTTLRVIITAERIVEPEYMSRKPHLVDIPAFRVEAVSSAPWGAHPGPMYGYYEPDQEHFDEIVDAGASDETFRAYLDKYVHSVKGQAEYLDTIGPARMLRLQMGTHQ